MEGMTLTKVKGYLVPHPMTLVYPTWNPYQPFSGTIWLYVKQDKKNCSFFNFSFSFVEMLVILFNEGRFILIKYGMGLMIMINMYHITFNNNQGLLSLKHL